MNKKSRIYIAGHNGLVGNNLFERLKKEGYKNIIVFPKAAVDLSDQFEVDELIEYEKPEYVFLCAAHVGGILENDMHSADIIYNNTMIQSNIIKASHVNKVKKLIFLGSSCIYPNTIHRAINENDFLSDKLEETNIGYAMAKINGIKMCQMYNKQYGDNFISLMPCNIFGIGDKYDLNKGHVLAALIMKVYEAKLKNKGITLWGDGQSLREFLYIDDLTDAILFLEKKYNSPEIINVGTGQDISILELAKLIMGIMNYECDIKFDTNKPKGTFRKLLDVTKINKLGWKSKTSLKAGLKLAVDSYIKSYQNGKINDNN